MTPETGSSETTPSCSGVEPGMLFPIRLHSPLPPPVMRLFASTLSTRTEKIRVSFKVHFIFDNIELRSTTASFHHAEIRIYPHSHGIPTTAIYPSKSKHTKKYHTFKWSEAVIFTGCTDTCCRHLSLQSIFFRTMDGFPICFLYPAKNDNWLISYIICRQCRMAFVFVDQHTSCYLNH